MKEHTFIWLLTNKEPVYYNIYDSCVVGADTEDDARSITPDGKPFKCKVLRGVSSAWAKSPDMVNVEKIGVGKPSLKGRVICSSFNAG